MFYKQIINEQMIYEQITREQITREPVSTKNSQGAPEVFLVKHSDAQVSDLGLFEKTCTIIHVV